MLRTVGWAATSVVLGSVLLPEVAAQPAPAGGRVLYELNPVTYETFVGTSCHATRADGGVLVTNLVKGGQACVLFPDQALEVTPDYRIDATLTIRKPLPKDSSVGIVAGENLDPKWMTNVALLLENEYGVLTTRRGEKWTDLPKATGAPNVRAGVGAVNTVAIEVRGQEILAFVNDQLLASGPSPVPLAGKAGLYVGGVANELLVTRFKITALAPRTSTTMTTGGSGATGSLALDFKFTPGGTVFFDDDLSTAQRFSATGAYCNSSYAEGGLLVVTPGNDSCEWGLQTLKDAPIRARFEVSIRILKGEFAGFVFGQSSRADNLHYHANLQTDGQVNVNLAQHGKSTTVIPWVFSRAVRTGVGATNRVAVEVLGQDIRYFVNGQPVGRVVSPEPVQGGFGIFVGGQDTRVVFTNLRATDLGQSTTATREARGASPLTAVTGPPAQPQRAEPRAAEVARIRVPTR